MIAGKTRLDERDVFLHEHIGHWILLRWRGDLFLPPCGQAYGSHLATFIICPYGQEIKGLNFCWIYCDETGHVFRVGEPLAGIAATWIFKYETLKKFQAESLSLHDIDFLELPDLNKEMHPDINEQIRQLRGDIRLNPFRHPGFPDDVSATCGASFDMPDKGYKLNREEIWIRLIGLDSKRRFTGTILNQPLFYRWRKGERVVLKLFEKAEGNILVCLDNAECEPVHE